VAADGAPRTPGGATHVTSALGSEDVWGCPPTGPAIEVVKPHLGPHPDHLM